MDKWQEASKRLFGICEAIGLEPRQLPKFAITTDAPDAGDASWDAVTASNGTAAGF
jgi:hypothetical protein